MAEDEFVPCTPTCQTCKPGHFVSGAPMRWQPTGEPNPFDEPPAEPYRERISVESVLMAPIRAGKTTTQFAGCWVDELNPPAPKPLPRVRRPLFAGLIRRLFP